jgi:antitoxin (DNA-binding transcriptional repressor) of toxin-antitoxin stability system
MSEDAKNTEGAEAMKVSVTDARKRLTELARRADAGEDVILIRYRRPVARVVPIVRDR